MVGRWMRKRMTMAKISKALAEQGIVSMAMNNNIQNNTKSKKI